MTVFTAIKSLRLSVGSDYISKPMPEQNYISAFMGGAINLIDGPKTYQQTYKQNMVLRQMRYDLWREATFEQALSKTRQSVLLQMPKMHV